MFSFFPKRKSGASAAEKRIKELKCRKISFVDCDFEELCRDMRSDSKAILRLTPVNYYAVKNEYILAAVYTSPDYSENYVRFTQIAHEKQTAKSGIFSLDADTVSKALAKVGIMIQIG